MYGNNFYPLRLRHTATGREYPCRREIMRIGRTAECDLVFSDSRTLSRRHAEVFFRDGNWYIRDTNSANGTYVNGRRLAPMAECLLNVGDQIRLTPEIILEVLPTAAAFGGDWRNETIGFAPISPDTIPTQNRPIGAEIATCPNGHFYDRAISPSCPICESMKSAAREPADSTVTLNPEFSRRENEKICPHCGHRVTGIFCPICGGRINDVPRPADSTAFLEEDMYEFLPQQESRQEFAHTRPACPPSAAPSARPSMAPPPAPSMAPSARPSMTPPPAPSMAPSARPSMTPPPAPSMAPSARPSMAPPPAAAKAPARKPGLLGKLFGGKKTSEPAPVAPAAPSAPIWPDQPLACESQKPAASQTDDIQFRGAAPQNINPGEYFTVKIMMYREDDYARADRETAAVADQVKAASSGVFQASRGQNFRIVLQSPDIDLEAGDEILVWNGIFAAADFEVYLPEGFDRRQLRLRGRVYSGDAVLTDLKLILQVSAPAPQQVVCEKVKMQTAFISYASADRAKVVARLQGIMLARPDMDLFFDVESLRRGEAWEPRLYREISQRDLFYLFWSHNAAASEWVRKELEYAVAQKTVEFIEPIPLEQPDVCPPPESLMCKHFNDWTLRYLNNQ